jgi:hypothetical protein
MYLQYSNNLAGIYIPTCLKKRNIDNPRKSIFLQSNILRYSYEKCLQIFKKGGNLKNTNSRVW